MGMKTSAPTPTSRSQLPDSPRAEAAGVVLTRTRLWGSVGLPLLVAGLFLLGWHDGVRLSGSDIFPTPGEVLRGIVELIQKGLLLKYIVASLFRVTWGFTLATVVGVPFGLLLG